MCTLRETIKLAIALEITAHGETGCPLQWIKHAVRSICIGIQSRPSISRVRKMCTRCCDSWRAAVLPMIHCAKAKQAIASEHQIPLSSVMAISAMTSMNINSRRSVVRKRLRCLYMRRSESPAPTILASLKSFDVHTVTSMRMSVPKRQVYVRMRNIVPDTLLGGSKWYIKERIDVSVTAVKLA